MRNIIISILASFLAVEVSAYERKQPTRKIEGPNAETSFFHTVIIYNNVGNCNANEMTAYRVLSGTENGRCYTFDRDMPGVGCEQFTDGGSTKGPCTSDSLIPRSVVIRREGPARCSLYEANDCGLDKHTGYSSEQIQCMGEDYGRMLFGRGYYSFKCEVRLIHNFTTFVKVWLTLLLVVKVVGKHCLAKKGIISSNLE
jgi:hypothetical protein